jgi:hypothetical protein
MRNIKSIDEETLQIFVPMQIKKRGGSAMIILPKNIDSEITENYDERLIKAFAKAYKWKLMIEEFASLSDIARNEGISISHATKIYRLNFISAKIVEAIINGTQPRDLRLTNILANKPPEIWQEQEELWGF